MKGAEFIMNSDISGLSKQFLANNMDSLLSDISALVAIPSVRDMETRSDNAPFGQPISHAFRELTDIAGRMGLTVRHHDGYALDISVGEGEQEIALLHHIDVVGAGDISLWNSRPYAMTSDNQFIYGRGVTDNKGPLVASLYLLKMFKEYGLAENRTIRLIAGGAEETSWECIEHYFKHNPQPDYAFSPDGDFPIVNGESGILYSSFSGDFLPAGTDELCPCQVVSVSSEKDRTTTCYQLTVILKGSRAAEVANRFRGFARIEQDSQGEITIRLTTPREKSRNPHKTESCMDLLLKGLCGVDCLDPNSKRVIAILEQLFSGATDASKLGLAHMDSEMGATSCCVSSVNMDQQQFNLEFDLRYPKGLNIDTIRTRLQHFSRHFEVNWTEHQHHPLSYLSPESRLIRTMEKAYQDVTGQPAECFSKRAASYARALKNGVAFGPTFPGEVTNVHGPNERLCIESLKKAFSIYVKVLIAL